MAWLSGAPSDDVPPGLDGVGERARITSRTGVAVTCRIAAGSARSDPGRVGGGHAPGPPVEIRVREIHGAVEVTVVNATPVDR